MTNFIGEQRAAISYLPFGAPQTQVTDTTHQYTGQEYDVDTGLYYYGARYYNPAIGRFMSVDPAGIDPLNPQSWNRYAYVLNNPYKYVDPDGEVAILAAVGAGCILGGCEALTTAVIAGSAVVAATAVITLQRIRSKTDAQAIPRTKTKTKEREDERKFVVRIQAQGRGLQQSRVVTRNFPVKASETLLALEGLKNSLTRAQIRERQDPFIQAEAWIRNVALAGGVSSGISKSFQNKGGKDPTARVDIEILRGERNVVP